MSSWPETGGFEPLPSESAAPICAFGMNTGDGPLGVAIVQNSSIATLAGEFRASCQQTAMFPERRLLAMRGRNWLFPGASSFTRIGGLLHVAPSLSEKRTKMSVSAAVGPSVYTR